MDWKTIASALMILSISTGGFAESYADRPDLGQQNRAQRDEHRDGRHSRMQGNNRPDRRDDGRNGAPLSGRPDRPGYADQRRDRDARPYYHSYRRGERLPPEYRGRSYVVDDWRGHHLRRPPRGYHWVQTGADYVLVAIATGIIADVMLNH